MEHGCCELQGASADKRRGGGGVSYEVAREINSDDPDLGGDCVPRSQRGDVRTEGGRDGE